MPVVKRSLKSDSTELQATQPTPPAPDPAKAVRRHFRDYLKQVQTTTQEDGPTLHNEITYEGKEAHLWGFNMADAPSKQRRAVAAEVKKQLQDFELWQRGLSVKVGVLNWGDFDLDAPLNPLRTLDTDFGVWADDTLLWRARTIIYCETYFAEMEEHEDELDVLTDEQVEVWLRAHGVWLSRLDLECSTIVIGEVEFPVEVKS